MSTDAAEYFEVRGFRVPVIDLDRLTIGEITEMQNFAGLSYGEILAGTSEDIRRISAIVYMSLRVGRPNDDAAEIAELVRSLRLDEIKDADADPPTAEEMSGSDPAANGGDPDSSTASTSARGKSR